MKIQLVGTGSILTDSLSACAVIDRKIMVDVPNGAIKAYRRLSGDPKDLDALLISHFHADHYFDVVFLLLELGLRQKRTSAFKIVGPTGLRSYIDRLFELAYPESYEKVLNNSNAEFIELTSNNETIPVGGYEICAVKVEHRTPIAYGYTVSKDGLTAGFSGDSEICDGVDRIVRESQLAFLDCSFLKARSGHMGLEEYQNLSRQYPETRIIPTHMSDEVRARASSEFATPSDGQVFSL